uniref:plastoquinol--plastocyanin reductase n=1 Tax=Gymnochlora stellata TaxID=67809 RepID=B5A4H9_GYMST|nr:cytochrome b6-f complex iron-sulfur subunit [Gymnochlora stellata]
MALTRSLVLAIAVNALLVGVLLYSVVTPGYQSSDLKSALHRSPARNRKKLVRGYVAFSVGLILSFFFLYRSPAMRARMNLGQKPMVNSRGLSPNAFLQNPDMVPDMGKRTTMNNLVLASLVPVIASTAGPYAFYFYPKATGGGAGAIQALDALGGPVTTESWFKNHRAKSRDLVQGIKGDPTYLIVNEENTLNSYGLNAVCTHLGCVVPWDGQDNKFKCPCHGSQYAADGHVVRGPAPRPLALAHVADAEGKIQLSPWTETDFRTGEKPWWA